MTEDIIDLYNDKKYVAMTDAIEKYNTENYGEFWAELQDDLDNRSTHNEDYAIFTGMVCMYSLEHQERLDNRIEAIKDSLEEVLDKLYGSEDLTDEDLVKVVTADLDKLQKTLA